MTHESYIVAPMEGFEHTHTIVFLHGKGSNCKEFADEMFESEASTHLVPKGRRTLEVVFPTVRWVFPSAPQQRSERFDFIESQWFDMWAVENPDERFESQVDGLRQSISLLNLVIAAEEAIIPRERIFLAGISQGFATAITAALLAESSFAGLIGLCAWVPKAAYGRIRGTKGFAETSDLLRLRGTPVFLGHSTADNVVPIENGRALRDYLSQFRSPIVWHEYVSSEHWIVEPQGVDDIITFIRANMK